MAASPDVPNQSANEEPTHLQNASLPTVEEVLSDPSASRWIKAALETALDRDPIDALNDALVLAALLDQHVRDVLGIDADAG